jgi:hypothetical protein
MKIGRDAILEHLENLQPSLGLNIDWSSQFPKKQTARAFARAVLYLQRSIYCERE